MEIHSVPVTWKNRSQVLNLQVLPEQQGFIETVGQCLSEADQDRKWRPVGLYHGKTLIGFAMYGYFFREYFPKGRLWLDRLLIDYRFQGRGYGRAALRHLLNLLAQEYPGKDVYLSVFLGNNPAIRLYRKFGFSFIGEQDIHGEAVMLKKAPEQRYNPKRSRFDSIKTLPRNAAFRAQPWIIMCQTWRTAKRERNSQGEARSRGGAKRWNASFAVGKPIWKTEAGNPFCRGRIKRCFSRRKSIMAYRHGKSQLCRFSRKRMLLRPEFALFLVCS